MKSTMARKAQEYPYLRGTLNNIIDSHLSPHKPRGSTYLVHKTIQSNQFGFSYPHAQDARHNPPQSLSSGTHAFCLRRRPTRTL